MVSSANWNGRDTAIDNVSSNESNSRDAKVVVQTKGHPDPVQPYASTTTIDTTKADSSSADSLQHQDENKQQQHQQPEDPAKVAARKKEQLRQYYNTEGHLEDLDGATGNGGGGGGGDDDDDDDDYNDDEEPSNSSMAVDEDVASLITLTPKEQAVESFQHFRYYCGMIVNAKRMQLFIVTLIAINAIMMGIGTFEFVTENATVDRAFEEIDQVFLIIFTIELAMQAFYHGWKLLLDGWLVFDLVIIVTSWSFAQVQIIRAFRIFRALRLITRVKVMKNLVLALIAVMPRMFAIGLLLFLVSYIFAVMFTQLFKDLYERDLTDEDYFGRMDDTFFSLFQIMTLDNWADIARQVMAVHTWAWLPFVVFVIVTGFVVVNLIIAVICDAISALHDDEKKKLHGTFEEDETTNNESIHPALQEDVREQLGALEDHVEELTRMQEQTLHSLAMLTRQIQLQRLARTQSQLEPQPKPQLQEAPGLSTHPVVVGGVGTAWRPS